MAKLPSLKELLEAGVHFGHETKRWNPKMDTYIFGQREKIHIIDLEKTEKALQEAVDFVYDLGTRNAPIIFLATKRQAQEIVKTEAQRVGAMYLTTRWLGGLFTNYDEVKKTINKMGELEEKSKDDAFTKREQLLMTRELEKLNRYVGGVRNLESLPEAIFIVDSKKEENAVLEAIKTGVKIVAINDTNSDPTKIDYPIPANDDAIRSISIIVKTIADAYEEGKEVGAKKSKVEEPTVKNNSEKGEKVEETEVKKAKVKKTEVKEEKKTKNPPAGGKKKKEAK